MLSVSEASPLSTGEILHSIQNGVVAQNDTFAQD